ncbi:MAG: hypothetical protein AAB075_04005 [Gemmatimonadota bacterium]
MASTILAIALLYFLAHGATALFTRTRVPPRSRSRHECQGVK